jgi:hypothetical protein
MLKKTEQTLFIVFKIDNSQSYYARCLEFIHAIEHEGNSEKFTSGEESHFVNTCVRGYKLDRNASELTKVNIASRIGATNTELYTIDIGKLMSSAKKHIFHYCLSITPSSKSNVEEFIFYAMMLQSQRFPAERVTCVINAQGHDDFQRFSQITKLLPNTYNDFVISYNGEWITPKTFGKTNKLLPIIEINNNSFIELTQKRKVGLSNKSLSFPTKLEKAIYPISFNNADKISDNVIDYANYYLCLGKGNEILTSNTASILQNSILDVVNKNHGISAVHYLLFAMLMHTFTKDDLENNESARQFATECYMQSQSYEDGVVQVMENIIQHAETEKGLLSARIHDSKNMEYLNYLGAIFPNEHSGCNRHLQIFVADYNERQTVIDNFLATNAHIATELKSVEEYITLADFMNEYETGTAKQQWINFRASNTAKCQGLIKFAKAITDGSAVVFARSSKSFCNINQNHQWFRDFRGSASEQDLTSDTNKAYLPGTQFNIIFPVLKNNEKERYPLDNVIKTTFESYSNFLGWNTHHINSDNMYKEYMLIEQEWRLENTDVLKGKKQFLWGKLTKCWDDLYEEREKTIYSINMEAFTQETDNKSEAWIEPLCKGFIESKWMEKGKNIYVAFTGYDAKFANVFRSTLSAARRGLIGVTAQIYFASGLWNDDEPDMIGPNLLITEATIGDAKPESNDGILIPRVPWECFNIPGAKKDSLYLLHAYTQRDMQDNCNGNGYGYRLSNTHVKLGNKVHIDTFYEMASHFMKQEVAKGIAFCLLQQLLLQPDFSTFLEKENARIYLYGYAAYSRTIINAAHEILTLYLKNKKVPTAQVSFIIFQTKQAGTKMDYEEQIYFSCKERPKPDAEVSVVQIAPISTTLTTFRKMWKELKRVPGKLGKLPEKPIYNLSALWVRNELKNGKDFDSITEEEKPFWLQEYTKMPNGYGGSVNTKDEEITGTPFYLVAVHGKWRIPVSCEKCYPPAP